MNKLLSAEFVRLFKSLVFKICLLFSVGSGIFMVLMRWLDVKKHPAEYAKLSVEYSNADGLIFTGGFYLIFAIAVFIGIFVGTEYSNGTIRNKIVAGHTRLSIYLSKLIICGTANIIIYILSITTVLISGNLLIGGTTMSAVEILSFTMTGIIVVLTLTALLLLFSMSIQSKSSGAVVGLLATIILLFAALTIQSKLNEPKYYDNTSFSDGNTGETIKVEKEKNPKYLTGTKRKVFEFLNNFLPVSQLYQIVINSSDNLHLIVIYDFVIIIVTTGIGTVVFNKKNLK
ncbi:MAG: ABC transporter permease [Lachnospiraceae bacterium]|nr:ABC transporter permease [Lachnospiraceae bacterium]MDE6253441.1 ABC transporter permease [Lachnospiraceae bacterium]